jgi:hypothetical protein
LLAFWLTLHEGLHDIVEKHGSADRFDKDTEETSVLGLIADHLVAVGGNKDDLGWALERNGFPNYARRLQTVHFRHLPVHEHQLKRVTCIG